MIFIKAEVKEYTYYWTGTRLSMKRENALEFAEQLEAEQFCKKLKEKNVLPYEVDRDNYEYGNQVCDKSHLVY